MAFNCLNSNKRQMKWRQTAWRWVKYRQGQGLPFKNAKQPGLKFRRLRTYVTVLLAYKATLQRRKFMISGRLRKVVAFENRTTKGLFRGEVPTHLLLFFYGRELIVRNFLVTYRLSFMLSLKVSCMRPGGGGDSWKGWGCSSEILN